PGGAKHGPLLRLRVVRRRVVWSYDHGARGDRVGCAAQWLELREPVRHGDDDQLLRRGTDLWRSVGGGAGAALVRVHEARGHLAVSAVRLRRGGVAVLLAALTASGCGAHASGQFEAAGGTLGQWSLAPDTCTSAMNRGVFGADLYRRDERDD